MRPRRLVLRAFGPFTREAVVDLRPLPRDAFLLVHGPTGSGKTSLLDAICYALYGESSGDERAARHVRSDRAPPELRTEVELDFEIAGVNYRIRRSPEQERGGALAREAARATLWRRTADAPDDADGEVLASKNRAVADEVQRLVGVTAGQFRQVVILPQGRFREVLTAEGDARRATLAQLFRTDVFARLLEALRARAAHTKAEAERGRASVDALLKRHEADSRHALVTRADEAVGDVAACEEARRGAETDAKRAGDALADANTAARLHAEADARGAERDALAGQRERIDADRARRDAADAADRLASDDRVRDERATEARGCIKALETAERALRTAEQSLSTANETRETILAEGPDVAVLERTVLEMSGLVDEESAIEEARKRLRETDDEEARTRAAASQTEEEERTARTSAADATEAHRRAEQRATALELRARALADAERAAERRTARQEAEATHARAQQEWTDAKERAEQAHRELSDARAALDGARRALLADHARAIAAALRAGEPCPVCGSLDHPGAPRPSEPTPADGTPDLDALDAAARTAEEGRDAAAEQARTAEHDCVRAEAALGALDDTPSEEADLAALRRAHAASEEAVRALPGLRAAAEARTKEHDEAKVEHEAALDEHRRAALDKASAEARFEALLARVPKDLRGPGALRAALGEARTALKRRKARVRAAEDNVAEAERAVQDERLRGESAATARAAAEKRAEAEAARWADAREAAGFADDAEWRAARLDPAERGELAARIDAWDRDWIAADAKAQDTAASTACVERPDVDAAARLRDEAVAAEGRARRVLDDARRAQDAVEQAIRDVDEAEREATAAEAAWRRAKRLSDALNGGRGLPDLERYVLAALLDEVLDHANRRLARMSRGRYCLARAGGVEDRRRRAGLDIEVHDAWSGRPRSVATLSGGEGFLASLSLALGLSDAVEARAGGARLDAVFVDEGFGTLDPESLDHAVKTLADLRGSGRIFGLVSHVPDLLERFDVRLRLASGPEGSTVRLEGA